MIHNLGLQRDSMRAALTGLKGKKYGHKNNAFAHTGRFPSNLTPRVLPWARCLLPLRGASELRSQSIRQAIQLSIVNYQLSITDRSQSSILNSLLSVRPIINFQL